MLLYYPNKKNFLQMQVKYVENLTDFYNNDIFS